MRSYNSADAKLLLPSGKLSRDLTELRPMALDVKKKDDKFPILAKLLFSILAKAAVAPREV